MRRLLSGGRVLAPVLVLAVVVWRLGAGPFLHGIRSIDGAALAAGTGIAMLTTLCCAWRWKVVARGLGIDLSLPGAVAAYYRSLFLNLTLPGGVVGDVHRAVDHGRSVSNVGRALRAVVWERTAGQVIQVVLTLTVLVILPSPVRSSMPFVVVGGVLAAIVLGGLVRRQPSQGSSAWSRTRSAALGDIRAGLVGRHAWPAVAFASTVVVAGHAATFLIAARAAGVTAPPSRMLPLALLAMLAMVLPSVGGWGPREGATAWIFAAAGLGAQHGVATAVVYGIMVLFSSLPGLVVLAAGSLRGGRLSRRADPLLREGVAHA